MKRFIVPIAIMLIILGFPGCSSAPKKKVEEIFTDRDLAAKQLNLANFNANRGHFDAAMIYLEDARRLAVSADDPVLRIKTAISRGSILFPMGRREEAFSAWESAALEGDSSGEPVLAALARIYAIRARLVQLEGEGGNSQAEEYKSRVQREMAIVRSDPLATAAAYVTLGLAEKQLRRWAEAEAALRQALAIHEREFSLEDAAYDWYIIASIRSMAGNHNGSLEALQTAIRIDRRVENGFGLASSWQAMGDVYEKAGRGEEARAAWSRAAEIYRAIDLLEMAERLESLE